MFYKTNDEQLNISIDEFVNEWHDKEEYLLIDIREDSDKEGSGGSIKGSFDISMYEIPDKIDMAPTYIVCIVVCEDGTKSKQIAQFAVNHELNNVFYLEGGAVELLKAIPGLKV